MSRLDLRKELKSHYSARRRPEIIDIPPGRFLTILGKGDPNGEEYQQAEQALYGMSFALKFEQKAKSRDYTVMHLESLWWIEGGIFDINDPASRDLWRWKSMIRQPDFITEENIDFVFKHREDDLGNLDSIQV